MGTFAAGEVVLLPFPFSDLSRSKHRPALLLADSGRGDWLACQITSNPYADPLAVEITGDDFVQGSLQRVSFARPGKLFSAHDTLFVQRLGRLQVARFGAIREAVIRLLRGPTPPLPASTDEASAILDCIVDVEETGLPFGKRWQSQRHQLTAKELAALWDGRVVAIDVQDEYVVFLEMAASRAER